MSLDDVLRLVSAQQQDIEDLRSDVRALRILVAANEPIELPPTEADIRRSRKAG